MPKLSGLSSISTEPPDDTKDYLATHCYLKKHKGKTWRQVVEEDPEYVDWVLHSSDVKLGVRLRQELTWALEER